jgi:hypothetical protein
MATMRKYIREFRRLHLQLQFRYFLRYKAHRLVIELLQLARLHL